MAEELSIVISADPSKAVAGLQSVNNAAAILQNQLERLQKIAALPDLNLNQISRVGTLIGTTQKELTQLTSVASRISPEFGKVTNSANALEQRIRIATSAEHEFNSILGATPALLAGVENPAQALGQEFLVLSTGIQRARAQGQSFGEIASTLAESMFSVQGVIVLATTALFSFGKELFGTEQGLSASTALLNQYGEKLKNIDDQLSKIKANLNFSTEATESILKLKFAGIDPSSLQGLQNQKLFDTATTSQSLTAIQGQIDFIDKQLPDLNKSFSVSKDIVQATVETYKQLNEQVKNGKSLSIDDVNFLRVNAELIKQLNVAGGDVLKIPKENLDEVDKNQKNFIIAFQETNKKLDDLTTQRNALINEKDKTLNDSQSAAIKTQGDLTKKQGDISLQQVGILEQTLADMKQTIEAAKKIQESGNFAIPKQLIIPDQTLELISAQNQKLVKQKEDLVKRLAQLDIIEAQTGVDQTKAKAETQLEITKIDIKLSATDFEAAAETIRQKVEGLLRVKPISLSAEVEVPDLKVGDIRLPSVGDLTKSIQSQFGKLNLDNILKIPVKLIGLTPENIKAADDLKKAISSATSFNGILAGEVALKKFGDSTHQVLGGISQETANAAKLVNDTLTPAVQGFFDAIEAGENPVKGFFDALKQSIQQVISKLIAAAVEAAILSAITGGASGGGLSFIKAFTSIFGGGREKGGPVNPNVPYLVGEKGPEIIIPKTGGTVIPTHSISFSSSEEISKIIDKKIFAITLTDKHATAIARLAETITKQISLQAEHVSSIHRSVVEMHRSFVSNITNSIERVSESSFSKSTITDIIKNITNFKNTTIQNLTNKYNLPAFASGGAVFGPTLAIVGEGFGVSRSNPEFIGTASQLKNIVGGEFGVNVNLSGTLQSNDGMFLSKINQLIKTYGRTTGRSPI